MAETNDIDRIYYDKNNNYLKQQYQINRPIGLKSKHILKGGHRHHNGLRIDPLKPIIRINKRKNMLNSNNKRRIVVQNRDAFNDYITVSVGKRAVLECNLENYNNEKV